MELERPKQKKKSKKKSTTEEADERPVFVTLADLDVDTVFPSTSICDNIPSQECFIAADQSIEEDQHCERKDADDTDEQIAQESTAPEDIEDDELITAENKIPTQSAQTIEEAPPEEPSTVSEDTIAVSEPSAPADSHSPKPMLQSNSHTAVNYPNLQQMQNELQHAIVEGTAAIARSATEAVQASLQPFTVAQLRELYENPEVAEAAQFEGEFVNAELSANYKTHPLYELLTKYSRCRHNLKLNDFDLNQAQQTFTSTAEKLWTREIKSLKYTGRCDDDVACSGTEKYDYYNFDEPAFDTASATLNDMLNLVCFRYTTNMYSTEIHKTQIEQRIRELIADIPDMASIHPQSPASLRTDVKPAHMEPIRELRLAISILFHFLRRSSIDKVFANDMKEWLQKLVTCMLRTATWQDHLFLIYHVLRCPAGVSDWATSFIQIPRPPRDVNLSPFSSNEIHHCIAFLRTLLLPIASRNEFLASQIKEPNGSVVDPVKEDMWILVDSDGDEDTAESGNCMALKEKDLIAFLNQIPLECMFSSITFAQRKNDQYLMYEDFITGHHLLKFIAFSSHFVELLGDGLGTYDTERYKQFAKMLSRLIRHAVVYLSDMHAIFKSNGTAKDAHLCARIQVEFDTFVLRASHFIYKSRFLGTWQYLAILPFSDLNIRTIWKLYYFLVACFEGGGIESATDDFQLKIREVDYLSLFNDTIIDVPVEDMYYLLQTFSSMALSRSPSVDNVFIERVTLDLFIIGFVNEPTKESCYKIARDLLVNITTKYPALISSILLTLKSSFKTVDSGGVYLFKSLPLDLWHPTQADFEISATWLLNFGFETAESSLARTMFSRLNWNFTSDSSELFLSHDLHVRMACLIAEVAAKHVPETVGLSGISESVRQVSNLVKGQSTKQQFTTWCWNMVTVLRLHCLDQSREHRIRIMRSPADAMRSIPELERLESVHQGVADSRPIALFLSMLCTAWGHSVPQICHKGCQQMLLLITDYRHSIVIRCLQLIAPLFLECPESLSKCDKFQQVLRQLLSADRTYMKMAKDLITTDYPGPVVEFLSNMIQAQCTDHYNYGLITPTSLVNLWLQCFTELPNWTKDTNAIYIVDLLLSIAFQSPETWCQSKEYFRFLYMKAEDPKQNKVSSFLPFLGGSQPATPLPTPSPNALWLALITLELEHEIVELQTQLWPELLRQMEGAALKCSIDNLIKKSASALGCAGCAAASLVLYKLANLIILCAHNHPLLPIVCQRFFSLYLARVSLTPDEERYAETYGVADKFFEWNVPLMKKLKKFLIASETYFNQESLKAEDNLRTQFLSSCCRLFRSFTLWLEETRLNKMRSLQQVEFPPQYDANRLALIFARNDSYWTEFLLLSEIRDGQKEAANNWLRTCFRFVPVRTLRSMNSVDISQRVDPKENIIRHLRTYDDPVPPPRIEQHPLLIEPFQPLDVQQRILPVLKSDFKLLEDVAKAFNNTLQELNYTDCNYKDLIRLLYKNVERTCTRSVRCSSSTCTGRSVRIVVSDPVLNERVKSKVDHNRQSHKAIVERQTSPPSQPIVMAIVKTQHNVRRILEMYKSSKLNTTSIGCDELSTVGIAFFYDILNGINEFMNIFPPSHDLLTDVISYLGVFIQDNQNTEGIRLLNMALRRPHLLQMISEIFTPSTTAPVNFLEMYKFVVESHMKKCDPKVLFVLLSKFDVCKWLNTFRPKLADISQLLKLILQGLESWNQTDAVLIQGALRRHLIHIFEFDFPEHYGEVLQAVIVGCSEQKLLPAVLSDLLNAVYRLAGCSEPDLKQPVNTNAAIAHFATQQPIFPLKAVQDTMALLSRHYQNERLQHGLHGLYPKHKDYCDTISVLLKTLGYSSVVAAVHAYPGLLADRLIEWLWPNLCDMFNPWLVPYYPQSMQQAPANWIKQVLSNNDVLLPWSELYTERAKLMIHSLVDCLLFMLDILPASESVLGNLFFWYEIHFAKIGVPRHILKPMHAAMILMPWHLFQPQPVHIDCIYRCLQQFLPECHTFIGHIFLRISWEPWLKRNLQQWDFTVRHKMMSSLLLIFVKLSFEPNVRENLHFATMLREAASYPWYLLDYNGIDGVFDWFVLTAEPSVILQLNSEHDTVDSGVLTILQMASSMNINSPSNLSPSQVQAKRMLYVKSVIRMLRLCGSKYQQLLSHKDGLKSFHSAVIHLLTIIDNVTAATADRKYAETEAINLMMEVVGSFQSQGEFTSRILVEAIVIWQSNSKVGSMALCTTLNAIGSSKTFTSNLQMLLEATIFNYFRNLESTRNYHNPSWLNIMRRLGTSLPPIEGNDLVQRHNLLTLHLYTVYKLQALRNIAEKIILLQGLHRILENYKTNDATEPKLATLWGLMIASGVQYLALDKTSRSHLLILGRYLQTISVHTDGWGDGVLGAFGLKKDSISKRRRLLTRCLSCIVFSLFPDSSDSQLPCKEYMIAIEELNSIVNSKKYADVRGVGLEAADIVQRQLSDTGRTKENVCAVIRVFYKEHYLDTLEDVWIF